MATAPIDSPIGVIEPEIFGFDKDKILQLSLDEYMAGVIETYLQAFVEILQSDNLAHPVNYNEGGMTIVNKIAALTGMNFSNQFRRVIGILPHNNEPGS